MLAVEARQVRNAYWSTGPPSIDTTVVFGIGEYCSISAGKTVVSTGTVPSISTGEFSSQYWVLVLEGGGEQGWLLQDGPSPRAPKLSHTLGRRPLLVGFVYSCKSNSMG